MPLRVIIVEDDPSYVHLVREHLLHPATGGEFAPLHAGRLADALRLLGEHDIDVILIDLGLPDSQGIETFQKLRAEAPGVPAIVLTGLDDEALGVQALREGAQDYLVKRELDGNLLPRALRCHRALPLGGGPADGARRARAPHRGPHRRAVAGQRGARSRGRGAPA